MEKFLVREGSMQAAFAKLKRWKKKGISGKLDFSYPIRNGELAVGDVYFCRLVQDKKEAK